MKAAYIVVEGKKNVDLLKSLLPADLLSDTEIVGMSDWSSAFSLAGTIMSERSRPVILIVDANSDNPVQVRERQQTLESLLLPAASAAPYTVCMAIPTLETIAQTLNSALATGKAESVQQHPLIQQITQFLRSSTLPQVV
jgi:hypothetical protein